ncbi:hypothetical protein G6F40_015145 [Rhizopus arrhizus]|nr:hypothetical protein G6F40_015145 [Rhizopus arrhizus]
MGRRRSPSLLAAPFAPRLFWDGRADTLKAQVLGPVQDSREMNHDLGSAIARLQALPPYPQQFQKAFGPAAGNAIDADRLARALAAYVATLRPQPTRFDAFLAGDPGALNDKELLGMHLSTISACRSMGGATRIWGASKAPAIRPTWAHSARPACAMSRWQGHGCTTACSRI